MVKLEVFRMAGDCHRKRMNYFLLAVFAYLTLGLLVTVHLMFLFPELREPIDDDPDSRMTGGIWFFSAFTLSMIFSLILRDRFWLRRKFVFRCPTCGRNFTPGDLTVLATRHCGSCGGRVLEEPDSTSDGVAPDLKSLTEYQTTIARFSRRNFLRLGVCGALCLGWLVIADFIYPLEEPIRDRPIEEQLTRTAIILPVCSVLVLGGYLGYRSDRKRLGLVCVSCHRGTSCSQVVIASRHCCHCGRKVLRDDPAPQTGERPRESILPTVREFAEWSTADDRTTRIHALLSLGVIASGIGWCLLVFQVFFADDPRFELLAGPELFIRGLVLLPGIVVCVLVLRNLDRKIPDQYDPLACRSCRKRVCLPMDKSLVIASRHCPKCGERFLRDEPPTDRSQYRV